MSFDELRQGVEDYVPPEEDLDEYDIAAADRQATAEDRKLFGMTAIERMFISIFVFLAVTVLGLALMIATGRLAL